MPVSQSFISTNYFSTFADKLDRQQWTHCTICSYLVHPCHAWLSKQEETNIHFDYLWNNLVGVDDCLSLWLSTVQCFPNVMPAASHKPEQDEGHKKWTEGCRFPFKWVVHLNVKIKLESIVNAIQHSILGYCNFAIMWVFSLWAQHNCLLLRGLR